MSFVINWNKKGVEVDFFDTLTEEDLSASIDAMYHDDRFQDCQYQIVNLEQSDLSEISLSHVSKQAATDSNISSDFPEQFVAIVTESAYADSLVFYYKLMAKTHRMHWKFEHFASIDQARAHCNSLP